MRWIIFCAEKYLLHESIEIWGFIANFGSADFSGGGEGVRSIVLPV